MDLYTFDRSIEEIQSCRIVGIDEAGRGPLAGPVVAAAVRLDLSNPIPGVNDSKKLSVQKRETLYDIITTQAVAWSVASVSPEEIDRINILQASLQAMKMALDTLDTQWSLALIDGNKPLHALPPDHQQTIIKGDGKSASIAAASIIAKVTRDRLMQKYHTLYSEYGFDSHKGYPTERHRRCVRKYGLSPIHRKTFCEKFLIQTELNLVVK